MASTPPISRTSPGIPSSSASCSRSSNAATPAAAASSSSPIGWRSGCTTSATCEQIDHADLKTCSRTSCPSSRTTETDPVASSRFPGRRPDRHLGQHVEGARDPLGLGPVRSEVQGQDHDVDRDARHRAARHAEGGGQPHDATKEDWHKAIDKLSRQRDSGQIRRFTDNSYTEDLTTGNIVASIGWSGDASLIGRDDVEWRKPTDGCDTFFDQMVIPVGAPNTAAALAFMNFVYRPEVQARHHGLRPVRDTGRRSAGGSRQEGSEAGQRPTDLPAARLRAGLFGGPESARKRQEQRRSRAVPGRGLWMTERSRRRVLRRAPE